MDSGRFFGFVIGGSLPAALAAQTGSSPLGSERRPLRADTRRCRDRGSGRPLDPRTARTPASSLVRVRHRRADGEHHRLAAARNRVLAPADGTWNPTAGRATDPARRRRRGSRHRPACACACSVSEHGKVRVTIDRNGAILPGGARQDARRYRTASRRSSAARPGT